MHSTTKSSGHNSMQACWSVRLPHSVYAWYTCRYLIKDTYEWHIACCGCMRSSHGEYPTHYIHTYVHTRGKYPTNTHLTRCLHEHAQGKHPGEPLTAVRQYRKCAMHVRASANNGHNLAHSCSCILGVTAGQL